jgi:hypothetical protein
MYNKIMKVYDTIQLKYVDGIINNEKNRKKISKLLLYNLDNEVTVKCDLENNPSNVMDFECMVATIYYDKRPDKSYSYVYLVFGKEENKDFVYLSLPK